MKVVGLISGGKDSCYNLIECIVAGHTIEALANLAPKYVDELDSYMYQSVGHMGVELYADAMNLPLYRRDIEGTSLNTKSLSYVQTDGDEVEDLYSLLKQVKEECKIDAVSVGAVFSDYQRIRVENVCQRLGLVSLSYMWRRDQSELLKEMIHCGLDSVLIKVAAIGLIPSLHLGKSIKDMKTFLEKLKEKYCLNVCGEGGEYETFTLDCPLFKKKIVIDETELVETPGDVGYLNFKSIKLVEKDSVKVICSKKDLIDAFQIKTPVCYIEDIIFQEETNEPIGYELKGCTKNDTREEIKDELLDEIYSSNLFWTCVKSSSVNDALDKLTNILNENGYRFDDIVNVKMFVKNMGDYAQYNKQYNEYFSINPPSRTCVEVPLDDPTIICLDVAAWKENTSLLTSDEFSFQKHFRQTLHVQSISHWAPANIGPYSQAVKIGDLILIAGMIGMIPGTLEVCTGGVTVQSRLAFKHIGRILEALAPKADIRSVVQGVCYVTDLEDISEAKRLMTEMNKFIISTYVVVSSLPKNALIEWQTWAHLSNEIFLYKEITFNIHQLCVTLRKRCSPDKSVGAVIATATCANPAEMTHQNLEELFNSCLNHIDCKDGTKTFINMTLYYKSIISSALITDALKTCSSNVSTCIVPVLAVEDDKTLLSIVLIKI